MTGSQTKSSIIISLDFSLSQLARISLVEFVSKPIRVYLDLVCDPGPGLRIVWFSLVYWGLTSQQQSCRVMSRG